MNANRDLRKSYDFGKLPIYILYIKFHESLSENVKSKYRSAIRKHNKVTSDYFLNPEITFHNAGFDLFQPEWWNISNGSYSVKLNLKISAAMFQEVHEYEIDSGEIPPIKNMRKIYLPVNYIMCPRSSMGSKTPLRQSNSIGVIDSGYRGDLIGVVDNFSQETYQINEGDRLFQILSPNLSVPYKVEIVNDFEQITDRGSQGFGSSGR
jgi:dUTPase